MIFNLEGGGGVLILKLNTPANFVESIAFLRMQNRFKMENSVHCTLYMLSINIFIPVWI